MKVITGDQEAELIYRGVRQAVDLGDQPALIIDIGGGSNECIIGDANRLIWKKSFDIGMARILERFKPSDPITSHEVEQIKAYYEQSLEPLFNQMQQYPARKFIGCAGTFETVRSILTANNLMEPPVDDRAAYEIPYPLFYQLYRQLLTSTSQERRNIKGLELFRVDMIVLAGIFVNFIMEKFNFDRLVQSDFSIKEGAVDEFLNP